MILFVYYILKSGSLFVSGRVLCLVCWRGVLSTNGHHRVFAGVYVYRWWCTAVVIVERFGFGRGGAGRGLGEGKGCSMRCYFLFVLIFRLLRGHRSVGRSQWVAGVYRTHQSGSEMTKRQQQSFFFRGCWLIAAG